MTSELDIVYVSSQPFEIFSSATGHLSAGAWKKFVRQVDVHNHTPLFFAVDYNRLPNVKELLEHRANPNKRDNRQNTPFNHAASLGHTEMVAAMLKTQKGRILPENPLLSAIKNNHVNTFRILMIKSEWDVSQQVLICAVKSDIKASIKREYMRKLLRLNVKLSSTSVNFNRLEKYTVSRPGEPNTFKKDQTLSKLIVILQQCTDVCDNLDQYDLDEEPSALCDFLLRKHLNDEGRSATEKTHPNTHDEKGRTALERTRKRRRWTRLLAAGAYPDWINMDPDVHLLEQAARKSDPMLAKMLLYPRSGLLGPNLKRCDALHIAASEPSELPRNFDEPCEARLQILQFLLDKGCDPNQLDSHSRRPLSCAATAEASELLTTAGAVEGEYQLSQ